MSTESEKIMTVSSSSPSRMVASALLGSLITSTSLREFFGNSTVTAKLDELKKRFGEKAPQWLKVGDTITSMIRESINNHHKLNIDLEKVLQQIPYEVNEKDVPPEELNFVRIKSLLKIISENLIEFVLNVENSTLEDAGIDEDSVTVQKDSGVGKDFLRIKLKSLMEKIKNIIKSQKPLSVLEFFNYKSKKDEDLNEFISEIRAFVNTLYFKENATFSLSASNIIPLYMGFPLYSFKDERAEQFIKSIKGFKFSKPIDQSDNKEAYYWEIGNTLTKWLFAIEDLLRFGACVTISGRETSLDVSKSNWNIRHYRVPFIDWFSAPFSDDFSLSLISLPPELDNDQRQITVRVIYKQYVEEYSKVSLSKTSRSPEYDFHALSDSLVTRPANSNSYFLGSMAIGKYPVRLVMLEEKKFPLQESSDLVEFHEYDNFGVFEAVKTGQQAPIYINIHDQTGKCYFSISIVALVTSSMGQVLALLKSALGTHNVSVGIGVIKKNTTFNGKPIQEQNKLQDYLNVLKGVSNDLIAPVLVFEVNDKYLEKHNENKKIIPGTSAGRVDLGELIQKRVSMSFPQLYSLKFRNINFSSNLLIVDMNQVKGKVNFIDNFSIESKPEFDEGFDIETDQADETDSIRNFFTPIAFITGEGDVICYSNITKEGVVLSKKTEILSKEKLANLNITIGVFESELLE